MRVWRKKNVTWLDSDGRRVKRSTKGSRRHETLSSRFYGTVRGVDGTSKQVPLTMDADTSRTMLIRLQLDADRLAALGVEPPTKKQKTERLDSLLKQFESHLTAKESTNRHVSQTMKRIRLLLSSTKAKTVDEMKSSRIADTLKVWRTIRVPDSRPNRKSQTISVETSNHYTRAIKSFSRWLWIEGKTSDDKLKSLRILNSKADRRVTRRALSDQQIAKLIEATRCSGKTYRGRTWRLSPEDRVMLYSLAILTGLRLSEIASLTVDSLNFEAKTVTLQAAYSKRRREDVLPLHDSLIGPLQAWIGERTGSLFPGSWTGSAASAIRRDLAVAGIPSRDSAGRIVDFHALRHSFVSSLARHGITPAIAQRLARHSTVTLTLDVYTHVETESLRESLGSLPAIG